MQVSILKKLTFPTSKFFLWRTALRWRLAQQCHLFLWFCHIFSCFGCTFTGAVITTWIIMTWTIMLWTIATSMIATSMIVIWMTARWTFGVWGRWWCRRGERSREFCAVRQPGDLITATVWTRCAVISLPWTRVPATVSQLLLSLRYWTSNYWKFINYLPKML